MVAVRSGLGLLLRILVTKDTEKFTEAKAAEAAHKDSAQLVLLSLLANQDTAGGCNIPCFLDLLQARAEKNMKTQYSLCWRKADILSLGLFGQFPISRLQVLQVGLLCGICSKDHSLSHCARVCELSQQCLRAITVIAP